MATATEKTIHCFENAGLGSAPFRFESVVDRGRGFGSSCDYCGTGIRYEFWIISADGRRSKVGCDCVAKTGDEGLKRVVQNEKKRIDAEHRRQIAEEKREAERLARRANAIEWLRDEAPELVDAFQPTDGDFCHWIIADMSGQLYLRGKLSVKQIDYARKLVAEHKERQANGGKTRRELEQEAKRASAEDAPEGRHQVTGTVISTKVQESDFGTQLKMLVEDDHGWRVWVSVPSVLQLFSVVGGKPVTDAEYWAARKLRKEVDYCQRGIVKGDRITFKATLTPSKDDPKFCFGKRPSGSKVLKLVERG